MNDGVREAGHQKVAQVAAGRAVGLVDQHEDVRPRVEVRRHVAELVDRRDDDARGSRPSAACSARAMLWACCDVVQARAPPGS